ncbi:maleylpyruvate isomerase family mycothiol-dependent enzyme [Cellulomonas sp. McL0617]|uniref:maleylpyruvate isomerase family mycothiol-dependent enzyme n=1 Tax=Cellulomonas sp. McL0617 TaxID=3415675 RepID=UPI003CF1475C
MSATVEMTSRADAVDAATAELSALIDDVRALTSEDFRSPTDCAGWTVRDVVAHLTGAADEAVHPMVLVRHMVTARTRLRGSALADALTAQQIADRAPTSDDEVVAELVALTPKAPAARARVPGLIRRRALPDPAALPGDTLGYLLDVTYTRDVWMHRVDIARATGRAMHDSGAEATIVGQLVRDLQRGWSGAPFRLVLTGRVEGTWRVGAADAAPTIAVDCVSLFRLLSGRSDETALVDDDSTERQQATVARQLRDHRILF